MKIDIKSPDNFTKVPWKNGLGFTLELAVSEGGSMAGFDWRLSIATVNQDGDFSDFNGYWRNLILLSGNGIELTHSVSESHILQTPLAIAQFDGGEHTHGRLLNGEITDFNVMVNQQKYQLVVQTYTSEIIAEHLCSKYTFIYSLSHELRYWCDGDKQVLPKGHLLQATNETSGASILKLSGKQFILVQLSPQTNTIGQADC